MKKILFIVLIFTGTAVLLSAQTATLGRLSGKVEIQQPGRSWQAASEGMEVPTNSRISTGFGSEARVVMDNAEITVQPLTRMTLTEYTQSSDTTTTKLFLGSGRIRTDVKRSDQRINDFQVRSPVATAAVRGTSFSFDGIRLRVLEGSVDFSTEGGGKVNVPAGSSSQADPDGGSPVPPAEQKKQESSVSPSTNSGESGGDTDGSDDTLDSARAAATGGPASTGSLIIIVQ
ncbi:MAG: FecR family protein [Spirochaetales bacterium]|nr:FecR family protein [Spirochaetales bacterium]